MMPFQTSIRGVNDAILDKRPCSTSEINLCTSQLRPVTMASPEGTGPFYI